jgi:nicotinate-nucleotide pyrophosphorylase (carboxylating)
MTAPPALPERRLPERRLPDRRHWWPLVELALAEDIGSGDVTTPLVVDPQQVARAVLEAREPLVVCGLDIAEAVFRALDPSLAFQPKSSDGASAGPGDVLASLSGGVADLLAAERTALNFVTRMCGVATLTRRYVDAVAGTGARIVDTRKTLPGWRALDKYATAVGGAINHRVGLFDAILLKDNHIAIAGGVELAVKSALANAPPHLKLQVEVESEQDAIAAVEAGAEFLLLDNRGLDELRQIANRVGDRALLEASGGVNLNSVRAIAETGVQRISVGALTHSAPGADVALEIAPLGAVPT